MAFFLTLILAIVPLLATSTAPPIQINDNLRPAGQVVDGLLTLRLYAGTGAWRPKGPNGPAFDVAAFGEEGSAPSTPGPLIRARAGTNAVLTLRNTLDSELHVFGLCSKPGPCEPIAIAAGTSREIRFSLNGPGTYQYWASRSARMITSRLAVDTQLGGAIIVDPADGSAADRIMVISVYDDGPAIGGCVANGDHAIFTINGASWPYTPRLHYQVGETARFRVINLSCDQHAMHLHGFYFNVVAAGDGLVDQPLSEANRRTEVTEPIPPGRTFALAWTPTRAGNWLFHCHMVTHMAQHMSDMTASHEATENAGMAGLVIGIEVTGASAPVPAPDLPVQRVSMVLSEDPHRYGKNLPGYRIELDDAEAPRLDAGPVPGPVLVLHRGQPAEITVINRMSEPTAIHWHGIEIDSFFDGVPGFGGHPGQLAQPIAAGQSFVARMTPPRAGTFIYHTHWHDEAQLAGGLYGALIVLEPGERLDPAVDHIVILGLNGVVVPGHREPFAINGRANPDPIRMRVGVLNRLRLINITANNVALNAFLVDQFETTQWTPLAKDGAALPAGQSAPRLGRQQIAVGETYDFQITPARVQNMWLEVRRGSGEWVLQAPIEIR